MRASACAELSQRTSEKKAGKVKSTPEGLCVMAADLVCVISLFVLVCSFMCCL